MTLKELLRAHRLPVLDDAKSRGERRPETEFDLIALMARKIRALRMFSGSDADAPK